MISDDIKISMAFYIFIFMFVFHFVFVLERIRHGYTSAPGGKNKILELQLKVVVHLRYIGTKSQTYILWKSSKLLTAETPFQPLGRLRFLTFFFLCHMAERAAFPLPEEFYLLAELHRFISYFFYC